MFAESVDVVIGVDSHRDSHALALVDTGLAALIAEERVDANREGYRQALKLASGCGRRRLWAVEGTGSYGAGLARFLQQQGERVLELERPVRSGSRGRVKSDALDALRAARAALTGEPLAELRRAGKREALRVLLVSREASVAVRRSGLNQLRALVLTAPAELRERLQGLPKRALVSRCLALRPRSGQPPQLRGTLLALRSCGRQVELASREAALLERELAVLVEHSRHSCLATTASARSPPPNCSSPGRIPADSAPKPRSRASPAQPRSPAAPARPSATASTAAATANSTAPCTRSCSPAAEATNAQSPTSTDAPAKARPSAKRSARSNATPPAASTDYSNTPNESLDKHRSIPRTPRDPPLRGSQGSRRSLRSLAARLSASVSSDCLTGVTIDQCLPTGHRWSLHQANRTDFSDAPGTQIVVKRWPLRQRTIRLPPIG
jgi:transposase